MDNNILQQILQALYGGQGGQGSSGQSPTQATVTQAPAMPQFSPQPQPQQQQKAPQQIAPGVGVNYANNQPTTDIDIMGMLGGGGGGSGAYARKMITSPLSTYAYSTGAAGTSAPSRCCPSGPARP